MAKKKLAGTGKCAKCSGHAGPEHFCYGCMRFICDNCGTNDASVRMGSHTEEAHWEENENES